MTYQTFGAIALLATMCSTATADTIADSNTARYESNAISPLGVSHQAQLTSEAARTVWAPATFTMTNAHHRMEHQAQLIAASAQTTWMAATYTMKSKAIKAALPLQHQAQLTALMTQYEWRNSTTILSN